MKRSTMLARLQERREPWDIIVVGGGATGVGVAVDAAARGFAVLLLEQNDFGKGTSSRSTKLVHGGVRYLEQGNLALVTEALRERELLLRNAPHLVHDLPFIVPRYTWWEGFLYGLGLKVYDFLSGRHRFGPSRVLARTATLAQLPNLRTAGLRGGILYHDGQFDDTRLLINMASTAAEQGATLLNYVKVTELSKNGAGRVHGVRAVDLESGRDLEAQARIVINAAGPFCDAVRRMADPGVAPLIAPSQGVHLVFKSEFLGGSSALMVPHTSDGRVMFAIPWHGHTLVGTTDTPLDTVSLEPIAQEQEITFILDTLRLYLRNAPTRTDILSVFAGIRPLVRHGDARNSAALSRDHTLHVESSGFVTLTGGKWTTYRNMAQDGVDQAIRLANLPARACPTRTLRLHGWHPHAEQFGPLAYYGSDAALIQDLMTAQPSLATPLHPDLPYCEAEVIWAARHEMARTVEDVLARRTRALFLNAKAAVAMAPCVASLLAGELGQNSAWEADQVTMFTAVARGYR